MGIFVFLYEYEYPHLSWSQTCPLTPCLEWPFKQEDSRTPGAIGRTSGTAATVEHMSGWFDPRDGPSLWQAGMEIFIFIYEYPHL